MGYRAASDRPESAVFCDTSEPLSAPETAPVCELWWRNQRSVSDAEVADTDPFDRRGTAGSIIELSVRHYSPLCRRSQIQLDGDWHPIAERVQVSASGSLGLTCFGAP